MKARMKNEFHLEGYVYESGLEMRVTGATSKAPGTEYIRGTLSVATDDECTNIVQVNYTYVTATTKSGSENASFKVLKGIIDGTYGTVMNDGEENAAKVRIDSNIALNDFYTDRNGETELVSAKRIEGGFIHITNDINNDISARNRFEADMIITSVRRIEANPEKNLPEKGIIKGAIFDFRKALLPIEFSVVNPKAIEYFESIEPSPTNPIFTKVWGKQISEVIVNRIEEESAFGESSIREVRSNRRDWIITGAAKEPYMWDDESTITANELKEALANREIYLASVKKRQDEYNASKNQTQNAFSSENNVTTASFKF